MMTIVDKILEEIRNSEVIKGLKRKGEEFLAKNRAKDRNGNYIVLEKMRIEGEEFLAKYRQKFKDLYE